MKSRTKVLFFLTLLTIFSFSSIFNSRFSKNIINNNYLEFNEKDQGQIKQSGFWDLTGNPIYINDLATGVGAHNWTWAETQPWCSGSGSWADPYVIENVTIDGQGSGNCIEIRNSDDYFIVRNCSLYNSGSNFDDAGIKLDNVDSGKIINNNCSDNKYYGIRLSSSNNNTLSGNNASNNGYYGIYLYESGNNMISGNTVNNCDSGIYLNWHCDNNTFSGNNARNNNIYGIYLGYGNNNTLSGNIINKNYHGIYLSYSNNNTLSGNIANNNNEYGINLDYSDNNVISGNIINNNYHGISLRNSNNNTLSGNLMNSCGISLYGSLVEMVSHIIDNTNLVNNKPVYYYVNELGLGSSNFTNAGQIILINCNNSIISEFNISDSSGIYLGYSNNSTISGNTVNSNYKGIYLYESGNNMISGNTASNNGHTGIHLWNSDNNTLSGNTANNNPYGIYIMFSDNNTLSGNNASNNWGGIYIRESDNNTLLGNTGNDNNYGIILDYSNNNTLSGNTVNSNYRGISLWVGSNNKLSGNLMNFCGIYLSGSLAEAASHSIDNTNLVNNKPVYYYVNELGLGSSNFTNAGQIILINCNNSIISEFNISDGSGIYLGYSNNNTLSGNTASNNCNDGICILYSDNNTLSGNTASNNNNYGISIIYSDNNTLSGNAASNNGDSGIALDLSNDNMISGNTVISNYRGISLGYGNNNTFSGNTVNNNYRGIYLGYSHNNILSGNNASYNNHYGIYLEYTDNNTLSGNTASNNNNYGIWLVYSDNNTLSENTINNNNYGIRSDSNSNNNKIFLNNFVNNGINAEDNGINNTWDNGIIGNYWDDYAGVDTNDDGIGDTPYIIPGTAGSQDNFPIWTDDIAPIITLIFPLPDSVFGLVAPNYNISIDELNLDTIWYTLDGGITNYTITGLTGTFNQTAWEALNEGSLTIRFYANDTAGNIGFIDIEVIIEIPEEPIISFGNYYLLFTFITILSFIILEKQKKK